jgi:serine/threonine protein kinase
MRERLFHEARTAGALQHTGIVAVFDVGQEGETAFIAMELVEGPSLQQLLASGWKPDPSEALNLRGKPPWLSTMPTGAGSCIAT